MKAVKCIAVLCIAAVSFVFCRSGIRNFFGLNDMSYDEAKTVYYEHKQLFNEAGKLLAEFPDMSIDTDTNQSKMRSDWNYYKIGKIMAKGDISLNDGDIEKLKNSSVYDLMKDAGILQISVRNGNVVFQEISNLSFGAGIEYSPGGEPDSEYVYEWTEIENGWYYYKSE